MSSSPIFLKTALVAALLCLSSAESWARPPRARELYGIVERFDRETHTLTALPEKKGKALNAAWKRDAKFIHNGKFADSAFLKEGIRACVYYRMPFFGKPFVTKIVWSNGG